MTAEIRMSHEVRAALGAEGAQRAAAVSLASGRCPVCGGSLSAATAANVVVTVAGATAHVRYAHPDCTPSAVQRAPAAADPLIGPDSFTMDIRAGLIEHGRALLPVLVAEMRVRVFTTGPELTDLVVSGLLSRGFTLVSRIRQAPRQLRGWSAVFAVNDTDDEGTVVITDQDGESYYTGEVHLPAGWLGEARRFGWCVLYAGAIGLVDIDSSEALPAVKALRATASAGGLVGGRIAVTG
jgi:CBS domain-containing protein